MLSVFIDSLAPARLALRANLWLLYLASALLLNCGLILKACLVRVVDMQEALGENADIFWMLGIERF